MKKLSLSRLMKAIESSESWTTIDPDRVAPYQACLGNQAMEDDKIVQWNDLSTCADQPALLKELFLGR